VIRLASITVRGQSAAGPFVGTLEFSSGLQIISADNAFGKSLAAKTLAWCLGVEPIFGIFSDDATCFPQAVLERLKLPDDTYTEVLSSECEVKLIRDDGRRLRLRRAIKGETAFVHVEEQPAEVPPAAIAKTQPGAPAAGIPPVPPEAPREIRLVARGKTMQDEAGGLQRFFFEWLGWPRVEVSTFKGASSEVYLENLVPSFYIDQTEGWADIQAQQIGRYGQLEIKEIAVEYLLGAINAINERVALRQSAQRQGALRELARNIAERVTALAERRDWNLDWSGGGSLEDIVKRWTKRTLSEAFKHDANVDLPARTSDLSARAEKLRQALRTDGVDRHNGSAPAEASQRTIELKRRRHTMNESLNTLRIQRDQTDELIGTLDHRIQSASDLLRLKETGVGRLEHVECPTCHRDLDPVTFALTSQSAESIRTHIESLKRDREMMIANSRSVESGLRTAQAAMRNLDGELREAERVLMGVTSAVGAEREQIAQIVGELSTIDRDTDRARESIEEIKELQGEIDRWLADAASASGERPVASDIGQRRLAFLNALRQYLVELRHSEVREGTENRLIFDEQYVPYFDNRRLRSLGSASDHSRLTAAYALALAATGTKDGGLHPGIVILDEPLQQNPDPKHRSRFIEFLSKHLARNAKFQTIIFTSLKEEELEELRQEGVMVQTPPGKKWLQLLPAPEPAAKTENPEAPTAETETPD
jgi:DNA repair exonuclease SbcCD ATPase subunit